MGPRLSTFRPAVVQLLFFLTLRIQPPCTQTNLLPKQCRQEILRALTTWVCSHFLLLRLAGRFKWLIKRFELNAAKSDDLFRYTSGRWLVDEKAQQQLRYVKFDLDRLCRLAAAYFSDTTKCVRVVKLEGNFNKALLLTMDDGNEAIAKIPCPNAGPPSLTTASEVATLKFCMYCVLTLMTLAYSLYFPFPVRSMTPIRVPKVFAWSSDAANPVGAEFIVMEKIGGVALSEAWETMNTLEGYKIIDQVVQIEKELANMTFPVYGSLFLRDSLPATFRQYPLPPKLDPEGLFCIGPSCKRTWWHGNSVDISQPVSKDEGPCESSCTFTMLLIFDDHC
jgi:hypothetical protein